MYIQWQLSQQLTMTKCSLLDNMSSSTLRVCQCAMMQGGLLAIGSHDRVVRIASASTRTRQYEVQEVHVSITSKVEQYNASLVD